MPYYIATVWTFSAGANDDGTDWHGRRVERGCATSKEAFMAQIMNESADDETTIGPVSLSKVQSSRY